jgi:hypothetical protein
MVLDLLLARSLPAVVVGALLFYRMPIEPLRVICAGLFVRPIERCDGKRTCHRNQRTTMSHAHDPRGVCHQLDPLAHARPSAEPLPDGAHSDGAGSL